MLYSVQPREAARPGTPRHNTRRMEMPMTDPKPDAPARRSFFGRLAGVAALGLAGLAPTPLRAATIAEKREGPDWPGKLKGRHRQVVDAYEVNSGRPLAFAHAFLATTTPPGTATSVVIVRSEALPIALNSGIWQKYKIGEALKIIDPETKGPATKNPFLDPKPSVLMVDDMAVDRLLRQGTIFGACDLALRGLSRKLASNANISADDATKEWAANLVPGIVLLPSGVWGLNRAQEAGCTYCTGGG
jgi:hypothetical protein